MYNASDENDFRKIVEPWSHKVQKAANRLTNVDTSTPIGSSQERRAARDFNIY